jgi:hypothetical protein
MNVRDDFARFQRESRLARNGIYTTCQKRWNARGETVERSIASRDLHCSDGETALEDPWGGTHCGVAAYLRNLEGDTTSQLRQPPPAGRQPRTDPRRHGHRADLLDDGGPIPHCRFSFPISFCDPLTFGDASCLMPCHLRFVSNSCHFFSRCIWGHSECLACRCARRPARTALRHVTATEVGGALVPKLIDELLRSELMCLNQVVRDRFQLATHG